MINELRLRCKEIKEEHETLNDFVKIFIILKDLKKDKIIIIEEVHVINNLSCDLLINNDIMKLFRVIIKWETSEVSNIIRIKNHYVFVRATISSETLIHILNIKTEQRKDFILSLKIVKVKFRKTIIVYATKTIILKLKTDKNVSIKHKVLLKDHDY